MNMTNGGFAAIAVTLRTLLEPGDEAIFLSPPWFFYELLIRPRTRPLCASSSRCPIATSISARIEQAITPRTKVVILNSPHNPSGRVVSLDELQALADLLTRKSQEIGHPIYILSDEPYRRIVFDGRPVPLPGRGLSRDRRRLLVRQAAPRAGHAHRLLHVAAAACPTARGCAMTRS